MIQNVRMLDSDVSSIETKFQRDILSHWHEILQNKRYPDKRAFRPQKFPKFLSQLAIISIDSEGFDDRLTGTTICEVLHLEKTGDKLASAADKGLRSAIHSMLKQASNAAKPVYYKGEMAAEHRSSVAFTALVLPFSNNGAHDQLDTLILAFDFPRSAQLAATRSHSSKHYDTQISL